MNQPIKKTVSLGKIDYNNSGRKNFLVELKIELHQQQGEFMTIHHEKIINPWELSIVGYVWNTRKTDCHLGGQCDEQLREYFPSISAQTELLNVWRDWHLNGMIAGCAHQEIGSCQDDKIMSQICPETGYKYGSAWLLKPLPDNLSDKINSLIEMIKSITEDK